MKFTFFKKFSLLFDGLLACMLVLAIEGISRHSLFSALEFSFGTPLTFLYNALLIFSTLLIAYLFKRRMFFRVVISAFWLILGIINGCVLSNRVTPFNFTDLKLVGDLFAMDNSKYLSVTEEVAIIIALGCLVAFLVFFAIKGPKIQGRVHRGRNAVCVVALVFALPVITKAAIQSNVLSSYFGNLAEGYQEYGFVYSFAASVVDQGMTEPDNYNEETITAINDSVETEETAVEEDDLPNIIFVQLESFIDADELSILEYSEDPIPNFHSLMENYTSGYLTVPVVGAGTANTEFEVLTGMGISYFGLGEYPYKTILKETTCESMATSFSQLGYATHAIHNNGGNFYSRATVFANMGFDTFTSKELMNITEYNEYDTWPTDNILVGETEKVLDSTEDQSDFVFTITVQSHGSYPTTQVFEDPEIVVTGGETEEEHYQWEYYINELHEVDAFIGDLIAMLEEREEKTIVVFYGDHLPTMGLEDEDMNNGSIYQTTYVTWNNFGLEKEDADVTTYQLAAYITDQLDIHEGTVFTYHQSAMDAGTTETAAYDTERELLQYDLLYGNLYTYGGEQIYEASDLVMGVEDVVVGSVEIGSDGETLIITGEKFTPWSDVYVNDAEVATEYISENELHVALADVAEGEVSIVVNQVGSSSTIFRSSNVVTMTVKESEETQAQQKSAS